MARASSLIGGAAGNTIAFNRGPGIPVLSISTNNNIRGNSIYSNSGLGIDLTEVVSGDGVTTNDVGDAASAMARNTAAFR